METRMEAADAARSGLAASARREADGIDAAAAAAAARLAATGGC
eukprot:gene7518-1563_t